MTHGKGRWQTHSCVCKDFAMAIQKQSVVPRDRFGLKHPKTLKQIEQRAAALAKAAKAAA
jgi:hypothetical protein